MILTAIVMVSLWDRGIDFLYLAPSIHGWSAGFLLLPLLLLASGIAWLLMAIGGALRAGRSSDAGLLEEPNMSMALERKSRANSLVIIVASVLGTLVVLSIVGAIIGRTTNTKADARLHVELNEADAIAALRVIAIAADTYRESYHHYPSSLKELGPSVSGGANEYAGDLIDRRLASGTKDGYMFSFAITMTSQGSEAGFAVHADPLSASTGGRHFYVNETGIIRWNTLVATSDSPAVE
jgi:type II secretory pathway pseudopilin PulG